MSFIGIKKTIRGDREFLAFLDHAYEGFWDTYDVEPATTLPTADGIGRLLGSLTPLSDERQRTAIAAVNAALGLAPPLC